MKFTAALLAGGASSRMGRDKALLPLGTRSILAQTVEKLTACADEVLVVGRSTVEAGVLPSSVRCLPDAALWPSGKSSMAGLYSALIQARYEWVFILACDMPFFEPSLLKLLGPHRTEVQAVVPLLDDAPQPLCAFYHRSVAKRAKNLLERGDLRLRQLLQDETLKIRFVSVPRGSSFFNVNTPEDYQQARHLLQQHSSTEEEQG